jgi:signal transduction histidine kinase
VKQNNPFLIPIIIGFLILLGSVIVFYQLNQYEHHISTSNKEKTSTTLESIIERREGRIHTIANSIVGFYASSDTVEGDEFNNFVKIILGSNSEVVNIFVLQNDQIIHSYPLSQYVDGNLASLFPTYPTVIDGMPTMTAVFPIDGDLSLIVAVPFDYFIQSDSILSKNYKLVLLSPISDDLKLYEIDSTQEPKSSVVFSEEEMRNAITVGSTTSLFGYKLQDHYDLRYIVWDESFVPNPTESLIILIIGLAMSCVIPVILIRTNMLKNKLDQQSHDLQKTNEHLLQVEKSKDEFVTLVVHDLKNPLVPILAYVDILLSEKLGSLNQAQSDRLRLLKTNILTMQKMIQDLLDANKLELGKLKLEFQPNNLTEIIRSCIAKLETEFNKKGITVSSQLQDDVMCECDKIRIDQVLTNLLFNALDFVPANTGKINIMLSSDGKTANLVVKDNGLGIPKDKIGNLFVKFYQITSTQERKYGGSGLGLSVCKGIIDGHRGKIWAESMGENTGSEFHIVLPLKQPP